MMTIVEAIKHYEDSERNNRMLAGISVSALAKNHNLENAEKCRQMIEWLRELQERRKQPEIVRCGECERSEVGGCELYCMEWMRYTSYDGYCHRGQKRRTDG